MRLSFIKSAVISLGVDLRSHKKFYYKPFAYLSGKDFNGEKSIAVDLPFEFFSEPSCQDFIYNNALNAQWPEGYVLPEAVGACDPICFCAIYRRQIRRYAFRRPLRAIRLVFAGYERMRRSVAQDAGAKDVELANRNDAGLVLTYLPPRGYHFSAFLAFLKSFM